MSALVCWADPGGGGTCGGRVLWRLEAGAWWGRCERCNAGTTAAAGEVRELEQLVEAGVDVGAQKDSGPRSDEHAARATGPGRVGQSHDATTPRERASTRGRR